MKAAGSAAAVGTCQHTEVQDRRIARSKRAIRVAFLELMSERGLDGFTVNELCDRADINRGTFYNHYSDKDAVLKALEMEFFDGLKDFEEQLLGVSMAQVALCNASKKPLPLLVNLFDYLRAQGDFLHAVLGDGGDPGFDAYMRDAIFAKLVESILHERYRNSDDPFVGYYIAFFASAYMGVISKWVETGMKESSQEMARVTMRLLFIKPGESIKL